MKTLRNFGMALLTIMLCVNLVACSDDDDDNKTPATPPTLANTSWKIMTSDEAGIQGSIFTFNEDQTVTVKPSSWSKVTYSLNGSTLKIVFNDDDYIEGPVSVNGNKATYAYKWYDMGGSLEGNGKQHNMTLQKQ